MSKCKIAGMVALMAALAGGPSFASRVTILHTNDTHSHIDDGVVPFSVIAAEKARRQAAGENVMLVDAGDYVQGTALGGYDAGQSVIDIMNRTGYDAATLGNHEFDYGMPQLLNNAARAAFKMVCCNLVHRAAPDSLPVRVFPSYTVVTSGTARVAFVGVSTPQTLVSSRPTTFLDKSGTWREYDFLAGDDAQALYGAVQSAVDEAASQADAVVVLGHLGMSPDCGRYMSSEVIAHTTNFVALIDGHSHSEYTGTRVKNAAGEEVILTQSGCYLGILGFLTLEDGKVVSAGTLYPRAAPDPAVAQMEEALSSAVERQLGVRVAVAPQTICSFLPGTTVRLARSEDCGAGDFAADAIWWYANEQAKIPCDFAVINGGNVRDDIPSGKVTLKTMRSVQPFGGDLCVVEVTGRQVLDALEFGAQTAGEGEFGGFLQVGGLKYTIDTAIASTIKTDVTGTWTAGPETGVYRVKDVQVYDRARGVFVPFDPDATYRVAGSAFTLLEGGDGFGMFKGAKGVEKNMVMDYLALVAYANAFGKNADDVESLESHLSPLAALKGYLLAYEKPRGSGRITLVGGDADE